MSIKQIKFKNVIPEFENNRIRILGNLIFLKDIFEALHSDYNSFIINYCDKAIIKKINWNFREYYVADYENTLNIVTQYIVTIYDRSILINFMSYIKKCINHLSESSIPEAQEGSSIYKSEYHYNYNEEHTTLILELELTNKRIELLELEIKKEQIKRRNLLTILKKK